MVPHLVGGVTAAGAAVLPAALFAGGAAALAFGRPLRPAALAGRAALFGLILLAFVALTLAQAGRYSPGALVLLLAAAGAAVVAARRPAIAACARASRALGFEPPPLPLAAALALLLLAAGALLARPGEYFAGGWDPGVYLAAGGSVAHRGGLIVRDPLLADLDAGERRLLFPEALRSGIKYPGFYVRDLERGTVVPQFQPLYPVLLAVASALGGARAMLLLNPLLALAGVLLLYRFAARVRGGRRALAAAALLAFNVVQIWNGRFSTSEPLAQVLLLAGFCLLDEFLEQGEGVAGAFAGAAFGLAPLTTITTLLVLPFPLLAVLAPGAGAPPRPRAAALWLPLAALLGNAAAWSLLAAPRYLRSVLGFFPEVRSWGAAGLAAVFAALLAAPLLLRLFAQEEGAPALPARGRTAGLAVAGAFLAALAWFALLRPRAAPGIDAEAFARLSWFLSPGLIGLAAAGAAAALAGARRRAETAFLLAWVAMLLFFLYDTRMFPSYPFALRRYTPLVIPGVALAAAWLPSRLAARGAAGGAAAAALLALAILVPLRGNRDLVRRPEWPGMLAFLEEVDRSLPREATVFCEGRLLAYALENIFDRRVVLIDRLSAAQAAGIERELRRRAAAGGVVRLLSAAERPYSAAIAFEPEFTRTLATERREQEIHRYPDRVDRIDLAVTAWRVLPVEAADDRFPAVVDLGENAIGLGRGFSVPVRVPPGSGAPRGGWARWTTASADLALPWPAASGPVELRLRLASGGGRAEPARVRFLLDGEPLGGEFAVPAAYAEVRLFAGRGGPSGGRASRRSLTILSSTWNPADRGIRGYPDGLGVLVDRIEVLPAGEAPNAPQDRVPPGAPDGGNPGKERQE